MKYLFRTCIACGVLACHSVPRTATTPANRTLGTFAYRAVIGAREAVGTFTIAPDTVMVEADNEVCRRLVHREIAERAHNFDCVGLDGVTSLLLTIDSDHPPASRWYATRTVTKSRQVCTQYSMTTTGQQVCSAYANEPYDVVSRFSGPLRVSEISSTQER